MTTFIGDYTCKPDSKGRVLVPSAFLKQMAQGAQERFVIKKDIFENCLVLYPMDEWESQGKIIREKTNPYNREHSHFLRQFFKGTAEVLLDSNNRILIPKRLLDEIDADKELILAGQFGKIEIWPKKAYDELGSREDEFSSLAEKILGGKIYETDEK